MWIGLAIVAAFFFSLRLAVVRSIMGWVLMVLAGPIVTVLARSPKSGDWEMEQVAEGATARDLRLHPAALAQFEARGTECETLGFGRVCLLRACGADGGTRYLTRVLVHEKTSTLVLVSGLAAATATPVVIVFMTFRSGGMICTFCSDGPDSGMGPQPRTECFPTLRKPEYLWRGHTAVVRTYAGEAPAPLPMGLPATGEGCLAFIKHMADGQRQQSVAAGLMRPDVPGGRMYTIKGALVATKNTVWPWKQRNSKRVLANEEKVLTQLGEAELLAEARRYMAQQPAQPTITFKDQSTMFPDDRGVPRPIEPAVDLRLDERAADPKFRALLSAASGSRQSPTGRILAGLIAFGLGGVGMAAYLSGLPLWVVPVLVAAVSLALPKIFSIGGHVVPPSESGRARILAQGLCPCCLYSLGGLAAEADGCITCPECGAAWQADRIIEPRTFEHRSTDSPWTLRRPRANVGFGFFDDRRQACQLVPPKLKLERLIAGDQSRPRLDRVAKETANAGRTLRFAIALALAIIIIGGPMMLLPSIFEPRARNALWVVIGVFGTGGLVLAVFILRSSLGRSGRPFINAMLAEGLCPSCANLLPSRPAEPDGCTTCSCGAAWKVPAARPA